MVLFRVDVEFRPVDLEDHLPCFTGQIDQEIEIQGASFPYDGLTPGRKRIRGVNRRRMILDR